MVFYFSGTGNSKLVATRVAEILDDELFSINNWLKTNSSSALSFNSAKPYIFVAPTYAWRIAKSVSHFMRVNHFTQNQKAYFILTCGDSMGNAKAYLKRDCKIAKLHFMGVKALVMPENYIALFHVPSKESALLMIQYALGAIEPIAVDIDNCTPFANVKPTLKDIILSSLINRLFYTFIVKDKKFYTTNNCTNCGWCEKICPLSNIRQKDGHIIWLHRCTHCMACICGCPNKAIEYGEKTKNKNRHYIP